MMKSVSAGRVVVARLMWAEALRMVAAGEIDPGAHLDMVGSLDCFPEALKAVNDAVVEGKVVLYPHVRQTPLAKVSGWRKQDEEKFLAAHGM